MNSLETPQWKCSSSRLEGRTSWIFSRCGRCSRLTTGTSETRSGGLRKGQSPCEFLWGLSGFLSRRCWGLRPGVDSVPECELSSPVLTWILGYFWSLPRGVSPRLERGMHERFPPELSQQCRATLLVYQGICGFPSRLSYEAFPKGCPTCHRGVSRSSALKSRQCIESRFPWNGLRHLRDSANGGTTLEFLSPFLWRAPPLEMRRERWEFIPDQAGKGSLILS